jgi:hypothetical protein
MARRQRVDSIAAAKVIAASAGREIAPPAHVPLEAGDLPFWASVIAEFPKADWTAHQLEVAAQLSKAMADLEQERGKLRTEGYVLVVGDKSMANPRHGIARDLTNSIMSLRRNLQLHARAVQGEARDAGKRKTQAKAIEQGVTAADDDFIARPTLN